MFKHALKLYKILNRKHWIILNQKSLKKPQLKNYIFK